MHRLPLIDIADVVALVNHYADATRLTAEEKAMPYAHLPAFDPFATGRATMTAAGDRLHPVFAAPLTTPAALNQLVSDVGLQPYLDEESGSRGWGTPNAHDDLLASCVASLVDWVSSHGVGRHGTCGARQCVDVFVDTSRPGTRRYCSQSCLDRDRVATWRARRQHGTPAPGSP